VNHVRSTYLLLRFVRIDETIQRLYSQQFHDRDSRIRFVSMNSTSNGDGPAKEFGLDRIMFEDAYPMQEAARKTSRAWRQNITTIGNPLKADDTGRGEEAAKDPERQASPPAPQLSRPEPLHAVHKEEDRSGRSEIRKESSSKKRSWGQYTGEESPQVSLQNSSGTVHITSKRRRPIEVISLSSSDDELPKPVIPPHALHNGKHAMNALKTRDRQIETVNLVSSSQDNESQDPPAAQSVSPLPLSDAATAPTTEPPLCPEQATLVDLILSGRNVFYTGSAGCGKSTVLKAFVKRLKEHPTHPKKVDIIAPTGRAALDINGSTFWSFAGWTPDHMKKPLQSLRKAAHSKFVKKRLRDTDVLVIDEISMMENHHFERLNQVMKEARSSKDPFGGVQLVVTGDFCQLPPVKPFQFCLDCGIELKQDVSGTVYTCPQHGSFQDSEKWAFCSSAWSECQFQHVNLTNIHRQSDEVFIAILQKCRLGIPLSPKDENILLHHDSETGNAIRLFSTREEVRVVNKTAFDRLPTQKRVFRCYDDFRCHSEHLQSKGRRSEHDDTLIALRDHRFDPCIELKQGMQVVLLVNLDIKAGLVNGSQGVITGFENTDPAKLPKAKEKGKGDQNHFSFPILSGEHAEVREGNIRTFMDRAATKELPIVLFQNRVSQTIFPDCRVNELGDAQPYSLLSRTQIPLVAGWAMTVHKSQGMTLNRVVVNLSKSFEEGQLYVALSRARSLQGLKVEGLGRQQGRNEQVRQFLWEKFGIR
jgi:ATP-dependent DNA helicase PIF1